MFHPKSVVMKLMLVIPKYKQKETTVGVQLLNGNGSMYYGSMYFEVLGMLNVS